MPRGGKRKGAGRKPGWNHKETHLIRVPKALSELILQYAHSLDAEIAEPPSSLSNRQKTEQMSLLKDELESVTESKKGADRICIKIKSESVSESKALPLTLTDLAKRIDRHKSTLSEARNIGSDHFARWSKERDPAGVEWEYRAEEKMFYPISWPPD